MSFQKHLSFWVRAFQTQQLFIVFINVDSVPTNGLDEKYFDLNSKNVVRIHNHQLQLTIVLRMSLFAEELDS